MIELKSYKMVDEKYCTDLVFDVLLRNFCGSNHL